MEYQRAFVMEHLYTGVICDVLDQMGYRNQALGGRIRPLQDGTVIFGPAFTSIGTQVYSMPESPLTAQCRVVDQLGEGEIYVLTIRGDYNCAVFGELFATAVAGRKGAGVLLDGYARDIRQLKAMDFPLFYGGTDPRTSKGRCEINECQIPIDIDGVAVCPGDYIFGDLDGVVVIPGDIADQVVRRALEVVEQENRVRGDLRSGASLAQVYAEVGAI